MNVSHGLDGLGNLPARAILSIGNFDGLHRGHQRLLAIGRSLRDWNPGSYLAVATFEPHPFTVLRPDRAPPRLTPAPLKRKLLQDLGVDELVELSPQADVLQMTAEQFWATLRDVVRPAHLIEGSDFTFGKGRGGTIAQLRQWAMNSGIQLHIADAAEVPLMDMHMVPVSSTLIRWLLRWGRARDAAICLGRPYALAGPVVQGHQRGRTIGVPTANLACGEQLIPDDGVYIARCEVDGRVYPAALSIGTLPTFGDSTRQVEAHLLGFSGDLYGRTLSVQLIDWLRAQRKYPDLEGLKQQIALDLQETLQRAAGTPERPISAAESISI